MKYFKSLFIVIIMVMAMVALNSGNAVASGCGGLVGLEIEGGSYIGLQSFMGLSTTRSAEQNYGVSTRTITRQGFVGVGIMTSANGSVSVSGAGYHSAGEVKGKGTFVSRASGEFGGVSFSTKSKVTVKGNSGY